MIDKAIGGSWINVIQRSCFELWRHEVYWKAMIAEQMGTGVNSSPPSADVCVSELG